MEEVLGPAAYQSLRGYIERALAGQASTFERTIPYAADGPRQVRASYVPDFDGDGAVRGFFAVVTDVSDLQAETRKRERAEKSLQLTRFSLDQASDAVFWVDQEGCLEYINRSGQRLLGYSRDEASPLHFWNLAPEMTQGAWPSFWSRAVNRGPDHSETTYLTKEGGKVPVAVMTAPVDFGARRFLCMICRDLSERHEMEAQLRGAQRMEAVGQLTGGVAHDFNNVLASIAIDADLLGQRVMGDVKGRIIAEHIDAAVKRGQSLTARLLAFSRQQSLLPKVCDVSELVDSLEELLARTLGSSIKLNYERSSGLWPVLIDPQQFEQALVNLAINARDAMPGGGPLIIETRNSVVDEHLAEPHEDVTAGDYVEVKVKDAGSGMPPEVIAKAVEPFFTTKDVNKGSGLGLSMVYGFVKQSEGHIAIESELGEGTTVILYLPRSREATQGASDLDLDRPKKALAS